MCCNKMMKYSEFFKDMKAALFDLDGVVIDTEKQYTVFWDMVGERFLGEKNFGPRIKGQSLKQVFEENFSSCSEDDVNEIHRMMYELEVDMNYINGVVEYLDFLRARGVKTALVTSSTEKKMMSVYKKHPDLKGRFDAIFTSEDFARGKPSPECYLLGARHFGLEPKDCVVFEDSYSGIESGKSAGMKVVALATTHARAEIEGRGDLVIADFTELDWAMEN